MDIKLKSNRKGLKAVICCGIMLILGGILVGLYPFFSEQMNRQVKQEASGWNERQAAIQEEACLSYLNRVYSGSYGLYWQLMQKEQGTVILPSELLFPNVKHAMEESVRESFDQNFELAYTGLMELVSENGGKYLILDEKTGDKLTNTKEDLSKVGDGRMPDSGEPYYVALHFLESGETEVLALAMGDWSVEKGREQLSTSTARNMLSYLGGFDLGAYEGLVQGPRGVLVVMAFSQNPAGWYLNYEEGPYMLYSRTLNSGVGIAVLAGVAISTILALVLPFWRGLGVGTGRLARIPLEVILIVGMIYMGAGELFTPLFLLVGKVLDGSMAEALAESGFWNFSLQTAWNVLYGIHVLLWAGVFGIWFCLVLSLRRIFTIGVKQYLKEQCWVVRACRWTLRKIRWMFGKLEQMDITQPGNRRLILLLGVNALLLTVLCSIWFFGIFGVWVYTVILFFVLRHYREQFRRKHQIVLDAARKMAEGNLDAVVPEENLGTFEPLKQELIRIQAGFRVAVEEEARSQNMKTELITNVSHDLKTPLTAIITYVNLLKDGSGTEEERRGYIETLEKKAARLKRLIEDLFEVSKATSGNLKVEKEPVDLAELVRQAAFEMEDTLAETGITCRLHVPDEKVYLPLDSGKTFRILENLLGNVAKYSVPGTRAYIILEDLGKQVRLIVKNVSKNELEEDLDWLKGRFVRGDRSRNTEGSGLGLAIVESFIKIQGGSFFIEADGDIFKAIAMFPKEKNEEIKEERP